MSARPARSVVAWRGRCALVSALALAVLAGTTLAQDPLAPKRSRSAGFDLLSASSLWALTGNRVWCGIDTKGNLCIDAVPTPTGGGGFWPVGPPAYNQYIYNSGLQIAGIVAPNGGPWARDTVGAYFFDARGTQPQGQGVTRIYSSGSQQDVDQWPEGAVVHDAAVYAPSLLGRESISREDSWVRYQDGPQILRYREHGMGILVEQRSLQFTYPAGNEDILYWVFTLTNITASDPSAYAGLDPAIRSDVADIAAQWVAATEAQVGVDLPPAGVRFDSLYVGLAMDPDVGNAGGNNSTAILPFETSLAYKSDFREPTWQYPLSIASDPFGPYPGFVGAALLKTPPRQDGGQTPRLTVFSNTTGGGQHPDPWGVSRLWRYLSASLSFAEGDPFCTLAQPRERRLCVLVQNRSDTRFYQSTGPFSLDPGESATVVMAYVFAGAIASEVEPFYTHSLSPGIPPGGSRLLAGTDTLRVIDRAAGWVSHADLNGDGDVSPNEVQTVPRSFLHKVKLARALVDRGFILSSPPEAPEFFLVPGDNRVTIAWQRSATEAAGDPYYAAAADPASALHDPNFRQHDVEGYRIYRGRRPDQLELIAQFDYKGTTFVDHAGMLDYGLHCAPELAVTDGCPAFPVTRELRYSPYSPLVQIPPGGRVLVENTLAVLEADTLFADSPFYLGDTGVPFVFVDEDVANFYPYYYAVTAFDVNSIASGPSSLESPIVTQAVRPRTASGQVVAGHLQQMELVGADGTVLDRTAPLPTISPTTGIFSGPMPPTNGFDLALQLFVPELVADGEATVRIDSILPGDAFGGTYGDIRYFLTATGTAGTLRLELPGFHHYYHSTNTRRAGTVPLVAFDSTKVGLYGGEGSYRLWGDVEVTVPGAYRLASWGRGDINGDPGGGITVQAGPRWWGRAANETVVAPNSGFCTPSSSYAGSSPCWTNLARTAGELPGVFLVWRPASYSTVDFEFRNVESITSSVYRAADFEVVWGPNGTIASVTDLTHHVPVSFHEGIRASWGFLTDQSFVGTIEASTNDRNNGLLTWADVACVTEIARSPNRTMCGRTSTPAHFVNRATLSPISDGTSSFAEASSLTASGNGFIFYLNGHFFLMRMAALPATGTVWHARFFAGYIRGTVAEGNYEFGSATRPPAVPGLTARLSYTGTHFNAEVASDSVLALIHTVPDPFYVTNALQTAPSDRVLKFVKLPVKAIVRIYSLSGVLVAILEHNDLTGGGEATWDVRNRDGRLVASGVYFYHVETPDGRQRIGRFTVITGGNFGSVGP